MSSRAVLLLLALLSVTTLAAQESDSSAETIALDGELAGIEDLLGQGGTLTEADVALAAGIRDGAEAGGTRSMRARAGVVAYLAGEVAAQAAASLRAEEAVRAAIAADQTRARSERRLKIRSVGFSISLGTCGLLAGTYDLLQYLGEAAYASYASAATAADAESARARAATFGIASTVTAGALALALASLLGFLGAGAISLP